MITVGKIISTERKKRNLTVKELSRQIGFIYETTWNIENYGSSVSYKTLDDVCNFFNLDKKEMAEINLKSNKVYKEYLRYVNGVKP